MIALTSIEGALFRLNRGDPVDWVRLIEGRAAAWLTCAVFIPPLYALTTHLPIGRRTWHFAVPAHLAASVLATVAKYSLYVPLVQLLDRGSRMLWLDQLRAGFLGELMFYWSAIGLCHAVFYYFRSLPGPRASAGPAADEASARLSFSTGAGNELLRPDEISWFTAEGNYVLVHMENRKLLVRHTLRALEPKLPSGFVRVHRSVIVNSAMVRRVETLGRGKYRLQLANGASLDSGLAYKDAVRQLAGKSAAPQ
ncbi:MAG TPA: LytTR family DNA-binding domain-containing protein [Allosphingosinicella sp.]